MTPFADFLHQARRSRNLLQRDLAELAGLSRSYVSALESSRKPPPTPATIAELARVMGLSNEELAEMQYCVRQSRNRVEIPARARPSEYVLLHRLVPLLGTLSNQQIAALNAAIATNQLQQRRNSENSDAVLEGKGM